MANELSAWFQEKMKKLSEGVHSLGSGTAQAGENITKHHIETRGTAKSGKRGRVVTGAMRNAVSSDYRQEGALEGTVRFGWLNGTPDYAWYQELGFIHWKSGQEIEGMYALSDARDEVVSDLKEDLRRVISEL